MVKTEMIMMEVFKQNYLLERGFKLRIIGFGVQFLGTILLICGRKKGVGGYSGK